MEGDKISIANRLLVTMAGMFWRLPLLLRKPNVENVDHRKLLHLIHAQ